MGSRDAAASLTLLIATTFASTAHSQEAPSTIAQAALPTDPQALETISVTGNLLGTGLGNGVRTFPGARTVVDKATIESSGATSIGDVLRRVPGVQSTDNAGSAGSAVALSIGVRGLTGRYSPRSTVLLDGVPLAVAPYGQPQLSFAPISLFNVDSIDVVRSGGAVRYGPQNVGGIINFRTRALPTGEGLVADLTVRQNEYTEGGGHNTQTGLYAGTRLDNGLGVALLYSAMAGTDWRDRSDERLNDAAVKFGYDLTPTSELYGRLSHYDVNSRTPGGLTTAQYDADPFQNTRPSDYWNGHRSGADLGYLNTLSSTQEFEVRSYINQSLRQSTLINAANTTLVVQPRHYRVLGVEPRFTQRIALGALTQDITVGYRYVRERGDDTSYNQTVRSGATTPLVVFDNATDAHAFYLDDRFAYGPLRLTPGVRFEHIESTRDDRAARQTFETTNNQWLPSINLAYLVGPLTLFTDFSTSYGPVQNIQLNSQTTANPLRPELARTTELGARYDDGHLSGEITAFKIRFDNQIQQVPNIAQTVFRNIGATRHQGVELGVAYRFDPTSVLRGFDAYANVTYTKALQESGATAGLDLPFYSRVTDTVGGRYAWNAWRFELSSTHQTAQFSDNADTFAEPASANNGRVPGFRLWNAQAGWKPAQLKRFELLAGLNNFTDRRYYTRNVDGNFGRMVGAPRTVYVQGRLSY